ncbi:hypothetical protein AB0B89_09365 [Sphaerisporangium sp. NPDC049002]
MSEQILEDIVASFGAGVLDIDQFLAAVEERVNALYPVAFGEISVLRA